MSKFVQEDECSRYEIDGSSGDLRIVHWYKVEPSEPEWTFDFDAGVCIGREHVKAFEVAVLAEADVALSKAPFDVCSGVEQLSLYATDAPSPSKTVGE